MPGHIRKHGLVEAPPKAMTFPQWQASIKDTWFTSQSAFLAHVVYAKVQFAAPFHDTPTTRAMGIFAHYGMVRNNAKCTHKGCSSVAAIHGTKRPDSGNIRYRWYCSTSGATHMHESVTGDGPLSKVLTSSWMQFLNFIVLLKINLPLGKIYTDIRDAWGNIDDKTFLMWRKVYQDGLQDANVALDLLMIGQARPQEIIVLDETHIGILKQDGEEAFVHAGISKGAPRVRSSSRKAAAVKAHVSKWLPAKTIWRNDVKKRPVGKSPEKPVTCINRVKKHAMKKKRKVKKPIGKDARSAGRWLWAAVSVGHGSTRYTHGNGLKRFTWKILPHRTQAEEGKPRGRKEIQKVFAERIRKGSLLAFDGWTASEAAAKSLGFKYAKPVVHDVCWRDAITGWHSNDIESEFNRLKKWNRMRHGSLMITEGDMHEYTFYINGGGEISDIMKGLSATCDSLCRSFVLK